MVDILDTISALYEQRVADLSRQLVRGEITLSDWHGTMRQEKRDAYAMQLRAGLDRPATADDYLKLGPVIKAEDKYLEQFAHAIRDGQMSEAAIVARAKMHVRSAGQMYWQATTGDVKLPAYPKDGSSECFSGCLCEWIDNGDGSWTWRRHAKDSCPTCIQRGKDWVPYWPPGARQERAA